MRLRKNSGEVRNQRTPGPAETWPRNSSEKLSMLASVLPEADMIGVSTSSTPRSAKNLRISAFNRARRCSALCAAVGFQSFTGQSWRVIGQERQQACFVPDFDVQFARLVELGSGGFAGDHEAGLLRDAAGHLGAQRLQ